MIDRLLERDEFADYWAMHWGDVLRIKAEFPVNLWPNAAQAYHRWVRASIADNKPYDQFVRELLTSSGSNFRVGPVNFYRAIQNRTPEGIATAVALTFMGSRAESWPKERLAGMAAFFSADRLQAHRRMEGRDRLLGPVRLEQSGEQRAGSSRRADGRRPGRGASRRPPATPLEAIFPDGTTVTVPPDRDPREVFADWLITPREPLVHPQHRQPRLGVAPGSRDHSRAGRHPAR